MAINNTIHRMICDGYRVEDAVSGGLWIFIGSATVSVTGFLFWFVLSRIVGVECVGVASAVVSAASIAKLVVGVGTACDRPPNRISLEEKHKHFSL